MPETCVVSKVRTASFVQLRLILALKKTKKKTNKSPVYPYPLGIWQSDRWRQVCSVLLMFRIYFLLPNYVVSVRSYYLLYEFFTSSC